MKAIQEESGFSDNPFMIGYDNRIFEDDENLGFKFPDGKLIGARDFISLDSLITEIKPNTGYPIVLNIGDSSTSGWNSNKVFKGNEDVKAPFFTYKTYSDLMREDPNYPNVINAGVPGYSSLQGRKYAEKLLKRFSKEKIQADYVTIYFGNDDCTYNQHEDKVRIDCKKSSSNSLGERVTVEDFKKNIEAMVETVQEYGARPVLIMPLVHYNWEPGMRSNVHREESLDALRSLEDTGLAQELNIAKKLYKQGKYRQACEVDRVLPRLKRAYRKALLQAARKTRTPIINIQDKIPVTNNGKYFVDYCHPLEKANQMIFEKFKEIRNKDLFHKPVLEGVHSLLLNLSKKKSKKFDCVSSDIYTLH